MYTTKSCPVDREIFISGGCIKEMGLYYKNLPDGCMQASDLNDGGITQAENARKFVFLKYLFQ